MRLLLDHKHIKLKSHAKNPSSPLEAALFAGRETIAELLLNRKDLWSGAMTCSAIWETQNDGRARILRLILDVMKARSINYTHESRTLLRTAVEIGRTSIVEVLLERPDNNHHHRSYGCWDDTHLLVATMKEHHEMVRALLQRPDMPEKPYAA